MAYTSYPTLPRSEALPIGATSVTRHGDPLERWRQQVQDSREAQAEKVRQATAVARETGAYWQEDPNSSRMIFRSGATTGSGSGSGSGTGTGLVDFAGSLSQIPRGPGPFQHPSETDDERALSASYARARDRAGLEAQGAAKSIATLMNRRGLGGSKFGVSQEGKAVRHGLDRLGEYNRDEAIQLARRRQSVADRNYAGGLTARGQDITAQGNRINQALSLTALRARTGAQAY